MNKVKSLALKMAAPAVLLGSLLMGAAANAQVTESATDIGNGTLVPLNDAAHVLLYQFGVPILLFTFAVSIAIAWAHRAKHAAKGRG